jgi:integrase
MAKIHLTDAAVSRYRRPLRGRIEVSDTEPGLFLWITANGTKSWMVIFRLPDADGNRSVRRKMVLGRHPAMGVAEARRAAEETMQLAAQGIDPEAQAAATREAAELEAANRRAQSFQTVAEEYQAAMKAGKLIGGRKRPVTPSTAVGRTSLLNRLVLPTLGHLPLADITPTIISRLLSRIEKEGGPVDATLKNIRMVFRFAQSRGLFHGILPTAGMTARQAPVKEVRALTDDELRAVWNAATQQGTAFSAAVRLLMLTGQRRSEISGLRWSEVDWERRLLIVPAERVKNRAGTHEVPLTEPALAILREMQVVRDALGWNSDLVFPSDKGDTPISGWTKLREKLDREVRGEMVGLSNEERRAIRAGGALRRETWEAKAQALAKIDTITLTPWRIHDLRHTFITRCRDGEENAAGEITWSAPLDVLQATVNHEITAGVTRVYDHGDLQRRYRLRKRELLEWWSRKLLTIVEGGSENNVLHLPTQRAVM